MVQTLNLLKNDNLNNINDYPFYTTMSKYLKNDININKKNQIKREIELFRLENSNSNTFNICNRPKSTANDKISKNYNNNYNRNICTFNLKNIYNKKVNILIKNKGKDKIIFEENKVNLNKDKNNYSMSFNKLHKKLKHKNFIYSRNSLLFSNTGNYFKY